MGEGEEGLFLTPKSKITLPYSKRDKTNLGAKDFFLFGRPFDTWVYWKFYETSGRISCLM